MEGLGITACSLECLGVFEPCTRLDHLGRLRYLASSNPASRKASDRSQVARRRVRLDLVTSGSLNSNSTSARTSLVPKPLPSCDAFASDWSIPRTWIGFFFPPSVPASKSNVRLGIPNRLSIQHCNVWRTDSCAKTLGKYCSCTSASVGRASSPPHHRRYEIDLATHRASQGHAQS